MIDILGFMGSGLIILSLTMKSILRLRIVGLAGALVFIGYGVWLGAWPVVATNVVTLSIHLVRLRALILAESGDDQQTSEPSPKVRVASRH